jgi:hypothetical protein
VAVILLACGGGGGGSPVRSEPRRLDAAPAPAFAGARLTIAAVGDTHGRDLPADRDPLDAVAAHLAAFDLFVFNHEGVSRAGASDADVCPPRPDQSVLASDPAVLDFLAVAGTNVATLANNHVLDCGTAGLEETMDRLGARGIGVAGADPAPFRLTAGGLRVAVTAYLAGGPPMPGDRPNRWTGDTPGEIAALAATSDLLIVSLHLHVGEGWTAKTPPEHTEIVEAALDAGADLVFAHGPHVPQGVIVRDGRVGFLSLGNFLFDPGYEMPAAGYRSVIAEVAVFDDRFEVVLRPLRLSPRGLPRVPSGRETARRVETLTVPR